MIPDRTQITDDLIKALSQIRAGATVADITFQTDIGRKVMVGEIALDEVVLPGIIVIPGLETPAESPEAGVFSARISYEISAFASRLSTYVYASRGEEYAIIDAIMMDVRNAVERIFLPSEYVASALYVSSEPVYHESAGKSCGARIQYAIDTRYNPGPCLV